MYRLTLYSATGSFVFGDYDSEEEAYFAARKVAALALSDPDKVTAYRVRLV